MLLMHETPQGGSKTGPAKMRECRARLRAAGLRPVQIWVPDTRVAHFAAEAQRQSLLGKGADEREALDLIDAAADWEA